MINIDRKVRVAVATLGLLAGLALPRSVAGDQVPSRGDLLQPQPEPTFVVELPFTSTHATYLPNVSNNAGLCLGVTCPIRLR